MIIRLAWSGDVVEACKMFLKIVLYLISGERVYYGEFRTPFGRVFTFFLAGDFRLRTHFFISIS